MWNGKTISVILPTYNEKDSIRQCILNFQELGVIDEIIVVNNNAVPGTSEEVAGTDAKEIFETRQGYGAAIRRGFREASGEYIVVCEPDGTFVEKDIYKLLAYATDYSIVFGSRTVKEFIWSGANMGAFLRWGNYAVAKLLEVLFDTNSLTDVGCTLRLISRPALEKIQPYFKIYDNYFGPEMILLACRLDISLIQIPVNYRERVGKSSVTGNPLRAFALGLRMISMILRHRMEGRVTESKEKMQNIKELFVSHYYYLLYCCLLILCVVWVSKPLKEFLSGDASMFVLLVDNVLNKSQSFVNEWSSGKWLWHPFLYQIVLILTGKIFGSQLIWFRCVGLICLLLNLYLIRKISNLFVSHQWEGRVLTFLSSAIFLLMPYTLNGAVHIDIDNTLMLPIILLFVYFFCKSQKIPSLSNTKDLVLASMVLALAFWAKLTTPLILPVALGAYFLMKKKYVKALTYPIGLFTVGGGIFILTWYAFCAYVNLPFLVPFQRIFNVFLMKASASMESGPLRFYLDLGLTTFWFNPLILFLWLTVTVLNIKDFVLKKPLFDTQLFMTILTFLIFFIYLFIGRITNGIPKYHYPCTALMGLVIAHRFYPWFSRITMRKFVIMLLFTALLSSGYYLAGDPLYLLNYRLKMQAIYNLSWNSTLARIGLITLIYLLPLLLFAWIKYSGRDEIARNVLLVCAAAQMIGFNFYQYVADYQVSYNYGYRGAPEVYKSLPARGSLLFPEGALIPPTGSIDDYKIISTKISSLRNWRQFISVKKPDAVIFGPALNTLAQMKNFYLTKEWGSMMDRHYNLVRKGDYSLYLKKK